MIARTKYCTTLTTTTASNWFVTLYYKLLPAVRSSSKHGRRWSSLLLYSISMPMLSSRHVHTGAAPGAALLGSYRHTHTIRNQNYGRMTPSNLGYCGIVAIEHLGFYHKLVDSKPISTPDFLSKTLCQHYSSPTMWKYWITNRLGGKTDSFVQEGSEPSKTKNCGIELSSAKCKGKNMNCNCKPWA